MVERRRAPKEDSENIAVHGLLIIEEVEGSKTRGQSETEPENEEEMLMWREKGNGRTRK